LQAFASIFPAELPDKTMVACIMLVGRHRRCSAVFAGAAAAFALHVGIAVVAGSAVRRLPARPVALTTAAVFTVAAVGLWRASRRPAEGQRAAGDPASVGGAGPLGGGEELRPGAGQERLGVPAPRPAGAWAAVLASFAVVAVAEFGDLTQLATASLAVRTGAPLQVAVGSLTALCAVAGLAVLVGRALLRRLRVETLQRAAAAVFAVLALVTLVGAVRP
jgi:putative Ca2+/H+ antiporter (TMEM165/GDT1 family)